MSSSQTQNNFEQSAPLGPRLIGGISLQFWLFTAIIGGLLAVAWIEPLKWMVDRWTLPESYYSHGFLVPFVALYFVWRDREGLAAARGERSMLGLLVLIFGILMLFASGFFVTYFTGAFAIIPAIWGLCGYLYGLRVMRRLALPMFILLFMIPLPLQTIDNLSNNLKLFVAEVALRIFNALGVTTVKDGATMYLGDATVTVGNACSGLRSLISLLFLGVLFASATDLVWWKRILLFLASMPIAIVSNVARVLVLCEIAYLWGGEAINKKIGIGAVSVSPHDASGYLIFLVAFALLYGTLKLLSWGSTAASPAATEAHGESPAGPTAPAAALPRAGKANFALRLASILVLLAATVTVSATTLYQRGMEVSELRTPGIPLFLSGGWAGSVMPVEADVTQILETNDVAQRTYRTEIYGNRPVQLAVVFSPTNRRVAHPPEVCYTNVGWEVSSEEIHHYDGLPDMVRLKMHHTQRREIVLYCFQAGNDYTANYYLQQYNIARNTLTRSSTSSALIRFSTSVYEDEPESKAEERLVDFARAIMPEITKHLK